MVCTPGRMVDHLTNSASVHMDDVEILVLDEVSIFFWQVMVTGCRFHGVFLFFFSSILLLFQHIGSISLTRGHEHEVISPVLSLLVLHTEQSAHIVPPLLPPHLLTEMEC